MSKKLFLPSMQMGTTESRQETLIQTLEDEEFFDLPIGALILIPENKIPDGWEFVDDITYPPPFAGYKYARTTQES